MERSEALDLTKTPTGVSRAAAPAGGLACDTSAKHIGLAANPQLYVSDAGAGAAHVCIARALESSTSRISTTLVNCQLKIASEEFESTGRVWPLPLRRGDSNGACGAREGLARGCRLAGPEPRAHAQHSSVRRWSVQLLQISHFNCLSSYN